MSNEAKIHLSKYETEVVMDTKWILTKQEIIEKICSFFGEMHEVYKAVPIPGGGSIGEFGAFKNGKISKGENYKGLPYVILDYPAMFEKENIFAIRTMFWWGNFFSITLHISGKKIMKNIRIHRILSHLKESNFFVCINNDEWQHNFDDVNYILISEMDEKQYAGTCARNFLKISKKIDLSNWNKTAQFLENSYRELIELIKISFPAGETAL